MLTLEWGARRHRLGHGGLCSREAPQEQPGCGPQSPATQAFCTFVPPWGGCGPPINKFGAQQEPSAAVRGRLKLAGPAEPRARVTEKGVSGAALPASPGGGSSSVVSMGGVNSGRLACHVQGLPQKEGGRLMVFPRLPRPPDPGSALAGPDTVVWRAGRAEPGAPHAPAPRRQLSMMLMLAQSNPQLLALIGTRASLARELERVEQQSRLEQLSEAELHGRNRSCWAAWLRDYRCSPPNARAPAPPPPHPPSAGRAAR